MARAIWSGSIGFGMVSIPVKLFGATESKDISFHLLHATCGTRLKQVRWCPLPSTHTIELSAFVKEEEIDPVFYEETHHLAPDERGEKAYALLIRTLEKKGLAAIATITIRKKEQLCALRPKDGALMLETLYYPDEIRAQPEMDLSKRPAARRATRKVS